MLKSRIIILLIVIICVLKSAVAQDTTKLDTSYRYKKVMIIPFEEQMYICQIQNMLANESRMNTSQIIRNFRYNIASSMQTEFLYLYSTTSLIHLVEDSLKDLHRVYGSISRTYDPIPEEPKEEKKNGLPILKKFEHKKKEDNEKTHIQNGQIVSHYDNTPRFMNAVIKDKKLLPYLYKKYGTDLFVFINEMDIENDLSDPYKVAENNYLRILKFHYTIYNVKGQIVSMGVVSTTFPSTENNVANIVKNYFPLITKQLAAKLPQPRVPRVNTTAPIESKTGGVLGK
ncbi:MAG: hypothetical protein NT150_13225 [Bacteroidetes bacterium]|nr:hypothetical protein [Bacteroidota bacterium]